MLTMRSVLAITIVCLVASADLPEGSPSEGQTCQPNSGHAGAAAMADDSEEVEAMDVRLLQNKLYRHTEEIQADSHRESLVNAAADSEATTLMIKRKAEILLELREIDEQISKITVSEAVDSAGEVGQNATMTGACDSTYDKTSWEKYKGEAWSQSLSKCGWRTAGAMPAVGWCLRDDMHISDACSKCHGNLVWCSNRNCVSHCISNSKSDGCKNCVAQHCNAEFERCSGLTIP